MSAWWDANGVNALIGFLEIVQLGLLRLLVWLDIAENSHGQPAWPWALKLSGENLLIDGGQARRLAVSLAVIALVVVLLLLAGVWKRARVWALVTVALLLLATPWPDARVIRVAATPASFHRSPSGFTVQSIVQGRGLYAQHCVGCHGTDGRGQGALADARSMSPPNLAGPLLWRRADGDLLWHVLHGMQDRRGTPSMPAFGDRLSDGEAWALIDFMKAQAAGETLRTTGVWALPAALPDVTVRCEGRPPRNLSQWRGQRVRIFVQDDETAPLEDPRLVTVRLVSAGQRASRDASGCLIDAVEAGDAWAALALVTGSPALSGTTLIADRDGWLRALSRPGQAGWSDDDLLCRTDGAPREVRTVAAGSSVADGLGALIRRMDAEPVRFVKGGFVH